MSVSTLIVNFAEKKLAIVKSKAIYIAAFISPNPCLYNEIAANTPIGGNNIIKEVAILDLRELNMPKKVNNGTISISAPPPINPANIPVISPVKVKPKKWFILYIKYKIIIYKKMERPSRSPPRIREINVKNRGCSLGFAVGLSISATILIAYYSRLINFMDPYSSVI